MKTNRGLLAFLFFVLGVAQLNAQTLPEWGDPVWADEFTGPNINSANWTYDTGGGGWGNNELEYYTDRPQNSYISNGCLVIEARPEQYRNRKYTSARLKTQGLHAWAYGRIEARISLPGGKGVWPAFWMLGANFPTVGWPACGELDILEHVEVPPDMTPETVRGSAHAPDYSGSASVHCDAQVSSLLNTFHVFAIEWEPAQIRWYVDGVQYFDISPQAVNCGGSSTPLPGAWIFDHPFFIILNVAIGGDWPGAPDATTPWPAQMLVDYVRVYQQTTPPSGSTLRPQIVMSTLLNGPNWQAVATVTVRDTDGKPVSGVAVTGAWSGLINVGVTQATTDANGVAVLNSGRVRQSGAIGFCVTSLIKSGYTYTGSDCSSVSH